MNIRPINRDFFDELWFQAIQGQSVVCPICNIGTAAQTLPAADPDFRQIAFEPCEHFVGPIPRPRAEYVLKISDPTSRLEQILVYPTGAVSADGLRRMFQTADGRSIAIGETPDGKISWAEWEGRTIHSIAPAP